jgi:beta-galactosidase
MSIALRFFSTISIAACALAMAAPPERRVAFNDGWRFVKGDAAGAQRPEFDDSSWRRVQLPHDWAIEGPFDSRYNSHQGGLPVHGTAWYRKRFTLPAGAAGSQYWIEFDGVMSNSKVWLNGQELGGRPYGYIGFGFDLTPHLRRGGQENVLAVRVAPEDQSSRWYPGAGIYRNVWLETTGPVRVARWGTYITTPEVTDQAATVALNIDVENRSAREAALVLETTIENARGQRVSKARAVVRVPAGQTSSHEQKLTVVRPLRWDVDHPVLYRAVTVLRNTRSGRGVVDRYVTPFGIRTIGFDRERGFLLNGRAMKLKGVCLHHDLGALGAAVSRRATERQLEIMKAMGANAVRTSHNPPSPELLEFADRLGLVVMDEAFDMWRLPKVPNGHAKYFDEWGERDLRDMLRRDRNHPSIVLWSIGNEVLEQERPDGWRIAKRLTEICHEEDPTRPVTAAFNYWESAIRNGLADQVDLPGFNYQPMNYAQIRREHPKWIMLGAETASCVSSRGVYHLPLEKYQKHESLQVSSYDIIAPRWGYAPDVEFDAQDRMPGVLGEFVWTGFDYLGEPTPYEDRGRNPESPLNPDWPSRSSYFGIVDLGGFPKARYYLYQSVWTDRPVLHVLPHWNWSGREGQMIPVMVYTNAEEVELFLNGRSLGKKRRGVDTVEIPLGARVSPTLKFTTRYRLMWQVPYAPGVLRAVGLRTGVTLAEEVRTAGKPARVRLLPDRTVIRADGEDLSFITVRIEDQDGNLCPLADNLVKFRVEGAGRIAAVDNGNAATLEPFQADQRKAFSGMALLIVRSERGRQGAIRVTAGSDGLPSAQAALRAK